MDIYTTKNVIFLKFFQNNNKKLQEMQIEIGFFSLQEKP